MAIKRSIVLFGDDGPNGPRAPIDESPGPGLGANNRALAYGEAVKSRSWNRATYALALNDDDLNDRLAVFEVGGLDAAYRLGVSDVAGGGRIIHVDGGAVEAQNALAESYTTDRANASFRARIEGASIDSGTGFDYVARAGGPADPDPGRGGWGFIDRRALAFAGPWTWIRPTEDGLLNPDGAGTELIAVNGVNAFFGQGQTALIPGVDLIEVLDSVYAGLYIIASINSDVRASLVRLDGTQPSFTGNTLVTFRVYRPAFTTAAGRMGTAPIYGTRFAAMPNEVDHEPALTLCQPSPSSLLLEGVDRTGDQLFSVDGAGNLRVEGAVDAGAISVGGDVEIAGDLQVGGTATLEALVVNTKIENLRAEEITADGPVTVTGLVHAGSLAVDGAATAGGEIFAGSFRTNGPIRLGPGQEIHYADETGVITARQVVSVQHLTGAGAANTGRLYGGTLSGITLWCNDDGPVSQPSYGCHLILPLGAALTGWRLLARPGIVFGGATVRGSVQLYRIWPNFVEGDASFIKPGALKTMTNGLGDRTEILSESGLYEVYDGTSILELRFNLAVKKAGEAVTIGEGGVELTWLNPGPR